MLAKVSPPVLFGVTVRHVLLCDVMIEKRTKQRGRSISALAKNLLPSAAQIYDFNALVSLNTRHGLVALGVWRGERGDGEVALAGIRG